MTSIEDVFKKAEECSRTDPSLTSRFWTKNQREVFRLWFKKRLKREPKLRDVMMDVPRKVNNTELALERFTKLFCLNLSFENLDN